MSDVSLSKRSPPRESLVHTVVDIQVEVFGMRLFVPHVQVPAFLIEMSVAGRLKRCLNSIVFRPERMMSKWRREGSGNQPLVGFPLGKVAP